ncbi:signal transduction histidine kinase [Lipingzhangella halophila]|uniref:histidine kinase n=1 Tax=Lipingzhangella halophila TaxID=1783352 RepID=A0A7W7RK26_9ACTN|nr:histidine kinase [Lipingzhangella halophila]MBB4933414.1 signal transduction histidine kinase [Lipingzhangella halophila]
MRETTGPALWKRPPTRFLDRHPRLVDVAVAGAYLLPTAVGSAHLLFIATGQPWRGWAGLAVTAAVTALLLLRRTRPVSVLAASIGFTLVQGVVTGQLITPAVPIMLYTVGVRTGPRGAAIAFASAATSTTAALTLVDTTIGLGTVGGLSSALIITAVLQLFSALLGALVGLRRRYIDALIERAEQAEREQEQRTRLAQADERNRISREIHDIVGHTLTAIVNLSDGVDASLTSDPEQARLGVRNISEIAREALSETRSVLSSTGYEEHTAPRTPQSAQDWLAKPLDTARATGLHVECSESGEPPTGHSLRTGAQRIVQEAVTNTLRHADAPTRIDVRVTHGPGRTEIFVRDDGRTPEVPTRGSGQGLLGMQERAVLQHGSATAGPAPAGGWYVYADLRSPEPTDGEP